jgi:beta-xylosidase
VRYPQDFPDPFVFRAGPYWYAMSTQRNLAKVPVIRSADLVHWEERGDALPALPQWSHFGAVWAPAVLPVHAGFVLYYATPDAATGLQCLSVAVSALPDGPYVDTSSGPLVCQTDRGGSIDPSPFLDAEGRPWLAWKSEGTVDGEPTRVWSQPLTEDGRALLGAPTELLHTALPWEGPIVEAPAMTLVDGRFHLFYSGNRWETSSYAVGHAVCEGPAGPCRRSSAGAVLSPHPTEA